MKHSHLLLLLFIPLAACGSEDSAEAETAGYHETLRPLVEAHCTSCHTPGGIGPFSMEYDPSEWAEGPPPWAIAAVNAVKRGSMPPWEPDPTCREYKDQRVLAPAEKEAFSAWLEAGFPEGDPGTFVRAEAQTAPTEAPSHQMRPDVAYTPSVERPDDYRCLPLSNTFEVDTWVTGTHVVPDQAGLVHHVILFLIPPAEVAAMEALDAEEEGPGYTCFGDSGIATAKFLAIWAPGIGVATTPEGSAFEVPAGSRLVMQMHYNVLNLGGEDPPADRTQAELWTLPEGELPEKRLTMIPYADVWFEVPAGETVDWPTEFEVAADAKIVGIAPHLHTLGTAISMSLERKDGSEECLVDVPEWDFNWQDLYWLPHDAPIEVEAGDLLRHRCAYDNTPGNQPVVNGERVSPRDVGWGDGTLDEMCLTFVGMETDVEAPINQCAPGVECARDCSPGDSQCTFDCMFRGGTDCPTCAITGWVTCGLDDCLPEAQAMFECVGAPECEDDICLLRACADAADTLHACNNQKMLAGECNDVLAPCGFVF